MRVVGGKARSGGPVALDWVAERPGFRIHDVPSLNSSPGSGTPPDAYRGAATAPRGLSRRVCSASTSSPCRRAARRSRRRRRPAYGHRQPAAPADGPGRALPVGELARQRTLARARVGTALGVFASRLFVPFLQIGASAQAQYPPFQIEIAWLSIVEIYVLFVILFIVALSALSALLVRMKIFQAIKLGETT